MRDIKVSTETFSLIWSARLSGEESEDEILRRILAGETSQTLRLSDQPPNKRHAEKSTRRSDVLWRDDILEAFGRLGGEADLPELYKVVKEIRKKGQRSLPISTEAVIRRELENNSSDSESFTAQRDLFRSVNGIGGGRWALR